MKQFFLRHRQSMLLQSIRTGGILSVFLYAVIRILAYAFPMDWMEEVLLFVKVTGCSCFLIASAIIGSAWIYKVILGVQRRAAKG